MFSLALLLHTFSTGLPTSLPLPQAHKVYVQNRLAESGGEVWRLLDAGGAHFYVCGDAGQSG